MPEVVPRYRVHFRDHWNSAPSTTNNTYANLICTSTKTGVSNPRYRQLIASGRNATTSFNASRQYAEGMNSGFVQTIYDAFSCTNFYRGRTIDWVEGDLFEGTSSFPGDPASLGSTEADLQARMEFFKKYHRIRRSFQAGVFFGELAESIRMIRRPGSALRQRIDTYYGAAKERLRRERTSNSKRKALAGTWLEYSYGWKPLVSDVDSAAETLASIGFKRKTAPIVSWGEVKTSTPLTVFHGGDNDALCEIGRQLHSRVKVRFLGAVNMEADGTNRQHHRWGLAPEDFVPTIYNLIPYSFLVDYFSNLGDLIEATCTRNLVFGWKCQTLIQENEIRISYIKNEYSPTFCPSSSTKTTVLSQVATYPGWKIGWRKVQRSNPLSPSVSVKDLRLRIPGVESPSKWLNIAALASLRR